MMQEEGSDNNRKSVAHEVIAADNHHGTVKITITSSSTNSSSKAAETAILKLQSASAAASSQQNSRYAGQNNSNNSGANNSMTVSHFLDATFANFESNKHVILTPSYMMHRQQAQAQQHTHDQNNDNNADTNASSSTTINDDESSSSRQQREHNLLPHRVIVLLLILHDLSEVIHYFLRVAKTIVFGYGYTVMMKVYRFFPESLRLKFGLVFSSIFAVNAAGVNVNTNAWSVAYYSYMGKNSPPPALAGLAVLTIIALIVHPDGFTWIILGKLW